MIVAIVATSSWVTIYNQNHEQERKTDFNQASHKRIQLVGTHILVATLRHQRLSSNEIESFWTCFAKITRRESEEFEEPLNPITATTWRISWQELAEGDHRVKPTFSQMRF